MYAVVTTGGKQYRVEAGGELVIERLPVDTGASVTFDRVLLVGDGESVTVGTPTVEGAVVSGTVLGDVAGPKLIIFKFKQKATYRRTRGHRQHLMRVRIDEISAGGKRSVKAEAAPEAAPAAPSKARKSAKAETADKPAKAEKPAAKAATKSPAAKSAPAKKPARAKKASPAEADDAPKAAPRRRSPSKKAESKE